MSGVIVLTEKQLFYTLLYKYFISNYFNIQ